MSEPFTTKELAEQILLELSRDIPTTIVRTLRIVLDRYVLTGVYSDSMTHLLGEELDPPLTIQRLAQEREELEAKFVATLRKSKYWREAHKSLQRELAAAEKENEVLREQNFAMNKTIVAASKE